MAISSPLTQFAILSLLIAAYDERTDLDGIGDWGLGPKPDPFQHKCTSAGHSIRHSTWRQLLIAV